MPLFVDHCATAEPSKLSVTMRPANPLCTTVPPAAGHASAHFLSPVAEVEVVAFTATQIPFIDDRRYPPWLAGERYPDGIQIHDESELVPLIRDLQVDDVVFSYSDVSHDAVMHKASTALAAGANFVLLGPNATMLQPAVPTVAVTAVRTGVGKSQTTRAIAGALKAAGKRVVAVRHPMPPCS